MMLHGVDSGVNGGETHLTHLTQKVDCHLVQRMKQNAGGKCQGHGVLNVTKSRSLLCVNDSVDVVVEDGVDDDASGGETHLTYLTQK
eukprot:844396-Ditylum_brightwellii.AAC.2